MNSEEKSDGIDRISNLSKPLLHHIMSFLPSSTTNTIKFVSKTFFSTWRSSPYLDLDYYSKFRWMAIGVPHFSDFVLNSLERRMLDDSNLNRLVIRYGNLSDSDNKTQSLLDTLKSFVQHKKVQHLILDFNATPKCSFHDSVFSLQRIKTLKLQGLSFKTPDLILTCPVIEKFSLVNCSGIHSFEVSNPQLKSVKFSFCDELVKIRVIGRAATSLQSFSYSGNELQLNIDIASCKSLRSLKLKGIGYNGCNNMEYLLRFPEFILLETLIVEWCEGVIKNINISSCVRLKIMQLMHTDVKEDWFSENHSALQFVESLKLGKCHSLQRIEMGFENLTDLKLVYCVELSDVTIKAPKLASFTHYICCTVPLPPVFISSNLNVTLKFSDFIQFLKYENYKELRDLIASFDDGKTLTLACKNEKAFIVPVEGRRCLFSPLYHLKHLHIKLQKKSKMIEQLIESLLWIAPRLNTLFITMPSDVQCKSISEKKVECKLEFYHKSGCEDLSPTSCCVKKVVMKNFKCYNQRVQSFFRKKFNDLDMVVV